MKNYTVGPGDTISRIILRELTVSNTEAGLFPGSFDCLIKYVALLNNKDLTLYDNIDSRNVNDPDSLKPGQILVIPETLEEAYNDELFKQVNNGACGRLVGGEVQTAPAKKMNLWPVYAGLGLLALLLLTRKKKRR